MSFIPELRDALLPLESSFEKQEVDFLIEQSLSDIQTRKAYYNNTVDTTDPEEISHDATD